MATLSIDYDPSGDVKLVLVEKESPQTSSSDQNSSIETRPESLPSVYGLGLVHMKVRQVHLRVSSSKLIASSCYFDAMLNGARFKEGKELEEKGFVTIELLHPEDDPTAMMVILAILYCADPNITSIVPANMELKNLEKLTILVDKYQWQDIVQPYAVVWFNRIWDTKKMPEAFEEILLCLWITWVFEIENGFKSFSRSAIQNGKSTISDDDETIRIPTTVIEALNLRRQVAIEKIEGVIEELRKSLILQKSSDDQNKPEQVLLGCMVLGFASHCDQNLKLGNFAAPDYAGISVRSLEVKIDNLISMQGYHVGIPKIGKKRWINNNGIWDLKYNLQKAIKDLKMDGWGLEYNEFRRSSSS
jgi:hypothetical protein